MQYDFGGLPNAHKIPEKYTQNWKLDARSAEKSHKIITSLGAVSIRKTVLPGMAIPMLKIRRPNGRLIFNMEIAIRR